MQPVKLYHLAPSHYCEKARKLLEFKRIPFEVVNVPYGNHQAVLAASGQDYVPFVEVPEGPGILWPDVADWAERVAPEPTLYPGPDAQETRARSRVVESWAHGVVEEAVWRYVVADVPKVLKDDQERWVFVELQERARGPLELLAHRKPQFRSGVEGVCALAEDLLGAKRFLLGAAPSLADFALYGALHPLKFTGHAVPERFERLAAWHERVHAL